MSDSDFNGRLFAPVITRPRRPLSNRASTASCSIRFSLRIIMSGARSSIRRFRRLFRLITRRYKSFRSEVENRPPSSGTSGRNSGGITGITSSTIHSGRAAEFRNESISFRRLTSFLRVSSDFVALISSFSFTRSVSRSMFIRICFKASAPIMAVKFSKPCSSWASRYSSSDISDWILRSVRPGSVTT